MTPLPDGAQPQPPAAGRPGARTWRVRLSVRWWCRVATWAERRCRTRYNQLCEQEAP